MSALGIAVVLDVDSRAIVRALVDRAPEELDLRFVSTSATQAARRSAIRKARYLIGGFQPITSDDIASCPDLRLIQKWGVGVDKIDLLAAQRAGVPVAVTSAANATTVAEHVLYLMIGAVRRTFQAIEGLQAKGESWVDIRSRTRYEARSLNEVTVGLVGFGRIGREVARLLAPYGASVLYYDPLRLTSDDEVELGIRYVSLAELLSESDIVSLHSPLTESTTKLFAAHRIACLKRGAILINSARGELIDEDALLVGLETGRVAWACLDVLSVEPPPPDHPFLSHPRVTLTPHVGGATRGTVYRTAEHVVRNVVDAGRGRPLPEEDIVVQGRGRF